MSALKDSGLSRNWLEADHLADTLLVPIPQKEALLQKHCKPEDQRVEVVRYWCSTLHNAAWSTLAGALYYLKEKEDVIKRVMDHVGPSPQYSECAT